MFSLWGLAVGLVNMPVIGQVVGLVDLLDLATLCLLQRSTVDLRGMCVLAVNLAPVGQTEPMQDVSVAALI